MSDSASRIRAAAVCRGRAAAQDVAWDLTTEIAVACHLCARDAVRVLRWALATERRYTEFRAALRAKREGNREPLARLVAEYEGGTP